ncbi:MAG: ATP phosphoribosyltransferase [Clostridia bacterium]|nr:ATP phosphoribosyltransferase [Clostridia bacterium]
MTINDSCLSNSEKIIFALREIYKKHGYSPYRMSKFEEYDLYAQNKDFLVSDNVITFNDTDGKLLALKPDVTLSIIKNNMNSGIELQKLFYSENVYRVSKGSGTYKEIMQTGVECIGKVKYEDIFEIICLGAESLSAISKSSLIAVSNLDILFDLIKKITPPAESQKALFDAIAEKNTDGIIGICGESENSEKLCALCKMSENVKNASKSIRAIAGDSYGDFYSLLDDLAKSEYSDNICIDFSVTGDINYYNGIVFKGFIPKVPSYVLSGGQYDKLMRKMGKSENAVGFAVYTDILERLDIKNADDESGDFDGYINIALPKGRLGEKVYEIFSRAGYECPSILDKSRKLIFENPENKVRYFWVKPSDVPIYVERGAADIGVAGKDILLEYEPDVFELCDMKMGKCRMAVAAPKNFCDDLSKTLRVATKFSNIAKNYYRSKGRDIDIIHLNGSIELAPILGLSDVIVDIVETGTTLKENDLEVFDTVVPISARLISNKASYKFKGEKIGKIAKAIAFASEENEK